MEKVIAYTDKIVNIGQELEARYLQPDMYVADEEIEAPSLISQIISLQQEIMSLSILNLTSLIEGSSIQECKLVNVIKKRLGSDLADFSNVVIIPCKGQQLSDETRAFVLSVQRLYGSQAREYLTRFHHCIRLYNSFVRQLIEFIHTNDKAQGSTDNADASTQAKSDKANRVEERQEILGAFLKPKGKKLIKGMVKLGYMVADGDRYKWVATPSLFGYFADVSSEALGIRTNNKRIPWRHYKTLITNCKELLPTAMQCINNYKNWDLTKPEGYQDILDICTKL